MTTTRPMPASMASTTASLVNAGGTKTMETSAPVSAMASLTVPKTVISASPCRTVVPALRALTPPTTLVPALSIRAVCLVPSPPVMPWTMTLLSLFRKIDISVAPLLARQLGGLVGARVHGFGERDQRVVRIGQDLAAFVD